MSKPKILFVSYTSDWTGPTNSLSLLLKYLREQYEVGVVLPRQGLFSEALEREGIRYFSLPSMNKWSVLPVNRLIRQERADLVYGNTIHGSSRNALIAAKLARVPFIWHVREMGWNHSWRTAGFMRYADAVVAVSNACADSIRRFAPEGKLHVVYNGVTLPKNDLDREAARAHMLKETGLPPDSVVILNVGHVNPRKGQEYAIEALSQIIGDAPDARLLLIGKLDRDPDYVQQMQTLIEQRNLVGRATILGFRQDAYQLMQGADLFLHTAVSDPHPRVVLEAMQAGIPVVAFAVDGVSETVLDGQTGILTPMRDVPRMAEAALSLYRQPALRTQMGQAGKRHVEACFTAEATARQVKAIIDRTLAGTRS